MTSQTSRTRDDIKATAVDLLGKTEELQQQTMFVAQEPDQALRALLAHAHSLSNATSGLLKTVFNSIDYLPPVFLFTGSTEPKDTGVTPTVHHLLAGSLLCDLATEALQSATGVYDFYNQAKANRDAGNDSVQLPPPDVQNEAFLTALAARTQENEFANLQLSTLSARLVELTERYGDRTAAATLYCEAIAHLLKGVKEDLTVARGEELKLDFDLEKEKAMEQLQLEGSGSAGEFVASIVNDLFDALGGDGMVDMMMDAIGVKSAGSRFGFLQAAEGEGKLASKALALLVSELADIEPISAVEPCLIGSHGVGAAPAESAVTEAPQGDVASA